MIILKYPIPYDKKFEMEFSIFMPAHSKILKLDMQCGKPTLWVLVTHGFDNIQYSFRILATGHEFHDMEDLQYIDTFLVNDGVLVWHLFQYMKSSGSERALSLLTNKCPQSHKP